MTTPAADSEDGVPSAIRVRARYRELVENTMASPHEWAYAWRRKLNRGGFETVDFLMAEVVETRKCVGCAACVSICPVDVFDYSDEVPVAARREACVRCILCAEACPVLRPPDQDIDGTIAYRPPGTDTGYGPYSYGFYARASRSDIRDRGQDGGMVTALLIHALETGGIEGAILGDVRSDNRQIGCHRLATDEASVLSCAGSRYTYSPNTLAFREAMRSGVGPVAVVGVPCQIDGVRFQQHSSISMSMAAWFRSNVALTIGLFCSESFTHESIRRLAELIGVEPERIGNINIKGKVVVRLDDGTVVESSLKEYRKWARPACLYCRDYAAEHADIAAGGIGIDGWTLTLVRTYAGDKFFRAAMDAGWIETRPLEDEPRGTELAEKLARAKRRNRPHPARMPALAEREALGHIDPKTFYTSGPGAPTPRPEVG